MGNHQSATNNGTTNSTDEEIPYADSYRIINGTSKLSAKLFGSDAIQHDPSMHQMQNDLLSIDQTIKNFVFRRKKTKKSNTDEYDSQDQQQQQLENQNYLQSTTSNEDIPPSLASITDGISNNKITWRCTFCTAENKITEHACRRCKQAETKL